MDPRQVYATLESACCQDVTNQQAAMKTLHAFESEYGFVSALVDILTLDGREVKSDCRLLAAISLKNVVSRCWKTRGASAREVRPDEKAKLKLFLLSCISESDKKVFLQLSAVTAKIARSDWPNEWPELIGGLFSLAQSEGNDGLLQSQAMVLLREVLISLKSNTLAPVKKVFAEAAASMFPPLFSLWERLCDHLQTSLTTAIASNERNLSLENFSEHLVVATQVISLVATKGFLKIQQNDQGGMLPSFFNSFSTRLHDFSMFVRSHSSTLQQLGSEIVQVIGEQDDDGLTEGGHTVSTDAIVERVLSAVQEAQVTISVPQCVFVLFLRRLTRLMGGFLVGIQKDHPLEMVPYLGQLLHFFSGHLEGHYHYSNNASRSAAESDKAAGAASTVSSPDIARDFLISLDLPSWLPSCISAVMFLSNTLHCRAYSEEVSGQASVSRRSVDLERMIMGVAGGSSSSTGSSSVVVFDADAAAAQARTIRGQFFTHERTHAFLELVLFRLLRYSSGELGCWADDPEAFIEAQDSHREQDTVKTAAEGFYLSLLGWAPELVAAKLASLLCDLPRQLAAVAAPAFNIQDPSQIDLAVRRNEEIFFWDAVYLCAGLNTAVQTDHLDAAQWINSTAGPLMQHLLSGPAAGALLLPPAQSVVARSVGGGQQILRSRFLWLLGCLSYQFNTEVLTQLVQLLLSVFESQENSDCVVLMNAVTAMQCVLCVEGVSANSILGTSAIVRLVAALCTFAGQRLQESDTRKRVVDLISSIVDSVGARQLKQQPELLTALITHLTELWTASEVNSPLRVSVIEAVAAVMKAAGSSSSSSLHSYAFPLISYATSGTQESSFLSKEGIKLWLTIARNTPPAHYSHALIDLMNTALPSIFEHGLVGEEEEDLQELMLLLEANAVAGGATCLHSCAQALYLGLSRTLGQVGARSVPFVIRPIEALLLSCPQDAIAFLLQSGLLLDLLKPCCASMPAYAAQLEDMQEADVAVVSYLSVFARIVLTSPSAVSEAVNALSVHPELVPHIGGATGDVLLRGLVRLMIDKFDCVGYCTGGSYRRKLWTLSLLSLYPTPDAVVLDWFPEVVSAADSILCEEEADAAEGRVSSSSTNGSGSSSSLSGLGRAAAAMAASSQEAFLMTEADHGSSSNDTTLIDNSDRDAIISSYEALLRQDAVMNSSVRDAVREKLLRVQEQLGSEVFARGMGGTLGPQVMSRVMGTA